MGRSIISGLVFLLSVPNCYFLPPGCAGSLGLRLEPAGTALRTSLQNFSRTGQRVRTLQRSFQSPFSAQGTQSWVFLIFSDDSFSQITLFIFGWAGSALLHRLFSRCGELGPLSSAVCGLLILVASLVVVPGSYLLLLFSRSVVSDCLQPHRLQHARLPCPSPSPRACSNSCLLSR